jgi:Na+-transporting methylmalonyl-CoA/oxaloacetate decarboxylase gamma subunit
MKILKIVLSVLFLLTMVLPIYSQENSTIPKRTPEQEASKQTEKLQQELNLNQEQANRIYEINLRYARERQISNKRSEALERMKNKNAEINQILTPVQNEKLQSKRYERTYLETNTLNHNFSNNSSGFKPSPNFRTYQTNRDPGSTDMNIRNNYRPVNPNFRPRSQYDQNTRRITTTFPRANQYKRNSSAVHTPSGSPSNMNRKTESTSPQRNNSSNTHIQTSTYRSSRSVTPVHPNRK